MVKRTGEDQPNHTFATMTKTKDDKNDWSPIWIGLLGIVPCAAIGVIAIAANIGTSARIHSDVERNLDESVINTEKIKAYKECIKVEALSASSQNAIAYRFACDSLKKEALQGS